jgi:DNA polymerase III alpha subunit (gram-positive type)
MTDSLYINYICDNVNELEHETRVSVLQMIFNSSSRCKIKEKGSGVQIKISDLSESLIIKLHSYIHEKIEKQSQIFNM